LVHKKKARASRRQDIHTHRAQHSTRHTEDRGITIPFLVSLSHQAGRRWIGVGMATGKSVLCEQGEATHVYYYMMHDDEDGMLGWWCKYVNELTYSVVSTRMPYM